MIKHPLKPGTKVQLMARRCPCSGKQFQLVTGIIRTATKTKNNKYVYTVSGENQTIPEKAIIKVIK